MLNGHVAISMNNVSIEQVLNKIEEASDYVFPLQ